MADCACGYTINKTAENAYAIFTNMLESDFLHTYEFDTETAYGMGWIPQNYAQTNNSGPYGLAKMIETSPSTPLGACGTGAERAFEGEILVFSSGSGAK